VKRVLLTVIGGAAALAASVGAGTAAMAAGPSQDGADRSTESAMVDVQAEDDVDSEIARPGGRGGLGGILGGLGEDLPDVNVANDLCLLPWYWPGPVNVATEGQTGYYEACNRAGSTSGEGVNVLNNACVAPWLWQGPVNAGTSDQAAYYVACNGEATASEGGVNVLNDACLLPWLWQGPVNVFTEGETATYIACNSYGEVVDIEESADSEGLPPEGAEAMHVEDLTETDVNVLNGACVLPWLWQGPINFLTGGQEAFYAACNSTE
jgi:hypothetical protein